jgi:hypothetical protein
MAVALLFEQVDAFRPCRDGVAREVDVAGFAAHNLGEQPVCGQHLEDVGRNPAQLGGFRQLR